MVAKDEAVEMPDENEGDEEGVTVEVKPRGRGRGRANGVTPATPESIKGYAAMFAAGSRSFSVFRKSGPKGPQHKMYRGRPIQTGFLKQKLPPEAAEDLVSAIDEIAGGGIYKCAIDGAKPHEVLDNIVIPGRPKPIDARQAADDEADIEEGVDDQDPLPHLGSGGYGFGAGVGGASGYRVDPGFQGAAPPPIMPQGFVWDPVQRRAVPLNPYVNGMQNDATKLLERENAELKTKATYEPLVREIAELKKAQANPVHAGESPFKSMIDMMAMQNAEAAKQRDHQLVLDREERKAKEAAEDKRIAAEKEDRKAREDREREDRKAQVERDREDRQEREKTAHELMTTLVKITTDGGKSNSDPVEAMVRMVTVMTGIKELTTPPGEPENVAMAKAVGATAKDLIGAAGEAWNGRKQDAAPEKDGKSTKTEQEQLLDVLEFAGSLAKGGNSPKGSLNALLGYCHGKGYDFNRVCELLAGLSTMDEVTAFRETMASKVGMAGASVKPKLEEAIKLLGEEKHQIWLLELGTAAKGDGS